MLDAGRLLIGGNWGEVEPEGLRGRSPTRIVFCTGFHTLSQCEVGSSRVLTSWEETEGAVGSHLQSCNCSLDLNPERLAFHKGLMQ